MALGVSHNGLWTDRCLARLFVRVFPSSLQTAGFFAVASSSPKPAQTSRIVAGSSLTLYDLQESLNGPEAPICGRLTKIPEACRNRLAEGLQYNGELIHNHPLWAYEISQLLTLTMALGKPD